MEFQEKVTFRGVQRGVQRENSERRVERGRVSERRVERGRVERGTLDLLTRLGYLRARSGYIGPTGPPGFPADWGRSVRILGAAAPVTGFQGTKWQTFCRSKIHEKIRARKKPPKISKIASRSAQSSLLQSFLILLPVIFDVSPRNVDFLKTCIFRRQEPNFEGPPASNLHGKSIQK